MREEELSNLQMRLANKIRAEKEARSEMERLRQELYLEEQEETARVMEKAEIETKIRQRLELRQAHMEQMYYKTARNEAEKQEEEVFRQQMLAKFAHDDEVELPQGCEMSEKMWKISKIVKIVKNAKILKKSENFKKKVFQNFNFFKFHFELFIYFKSK